MDCRWIIAISLLSNVASVSENQIIRTRSDFTRTSIVSGTVVKLDDHTKTIPSAKYTYFYPTNAVMRAVISSYARLSTADIGIVDQFGYRLYGDNGLMHEDVLTRRTAEVFAAELEGSSAFMRMVCLIATAPLGEFESLVGRSFND